MSTKYHTSKISVKLFNRLQEFGFTDIENIQELIGELNETLRHELEHISQHQKGYNFPKEPRNPLKYYTQPHELEAQLAGFKRRSRKENKDLEQVIRGWFRRNEKKHRLKPKQVETIINKLIEMS